MAWQHKDPAIPLSVTPISTGHGATAAATSQFTGDAYELTWEDARMIANSGEEVGKVYLIDTYAEAANSFVIVPISPELTNHFAMQRTKV